MSARSRWASRASFADEAPEDGRALALLTTGAMRARRRPFAILFVYAFQATCALAVAWPMTALVRRAYGAHPDGDALLFEPGGLDLLAMLVELLPARSALVPPLVLGVAFAAVVGLVPLAALIASLMCARRDRTAPRILDVLPIAFRSFGPFAVLLALTLLVRVAVVGVGFGFGALVTAGTERSLGDARAAQLGAAATVLMVALALAVNAAEDVARAAIVRFRVGALPSIRIAAFVLRGAGLRLLWEWAWRGIAGLLLVAMAASLATRLGGRGGATLAFLFVVHQAVVLARVALRASWLAAALRAIDSQPEVAEVDGERFGLP
jgi:hypothetical protein